MSEEKKPEEQVEEQQEEEQTQECACGHHGHHGGWGWHRRSHMMRRRMWMRFASMTVAEEVEFLEDVKARLDERLSIVNERLAKLKA